MWSGRFLPDVDRVIPLCVTNEEKEAIIFRKRSDIIAVHLGLYYSTYYSLYYSLHLYTYEYTYTDSLIADKSIIWGDRLHCEIALPVGNSQVYLLFIARASMAEVIRNLFSISIMVIITYSQTNMCVEKCGNKIHVWPYITFTRQINTYKVSRCLSPTRHYKNVWKIMNKHFCGRYNPWSSNSSNTTGSSLMLLDFFFASICKVNSYISLYKGLFKKWLHSIHEMPSSLRRFLIWQLTTVEMSPNHEEYQTSL